MDTDSSGDSVKFTRDLQTSASGWAPGSCWARVSRGCSRKPPYGRARIGGGETIAATSSCSARGVHSTNRDDGRRQAADRTGKGYSATFPVNNDGVRCRDRPVDEELLVVLVRMGDRLRITSSAESPVYETTYRDSDFGSSGSWPRPVAARGDYERGTYRACNRPMTPGGPPILGRAGTTTFTSTAAWAYGVHHGLQRLSRIVARSDQRYENGESRRRPDAGVPP